MAASVNPRQARFIARYLANGLNATQAAMAAGYARRTAASQGARLLKHAKIRAAIDAALSKIAARDYLKASRILRQLGCIAFGDPRAFFDARGRLKPISALDDEAAALLAGFEVVTRTVPGSKPAAVEYVAKVKFRDTARALELLGKYRKLGLWVEKVEHRVVKLEDLVAGEADETTT